MDKLLTKRKKQHIPDVVISNFSDKCEIRLNKPNLRPTAHVMQVKGTPKHPKTGYKGRLHVFYAVPKGKGWRGDLAVVTIENRYYNLPCFMIEVEDPKGVIPKKFRKLFKNYHTKHRNKKGEYEILEREV